MKPPWYLLRSAVSVGIPALVVAVVANLLVRALAVHAGDVPDDLRALNGEEFIMGTIAPIIGNTGGFFAAYRHPYRDGVAPRLRHHLLFLLPGAAFLCVGLIRGIASIPSGASTATVLTVLAVNVIPTAIIVPALWRFGHPRVSLSTLT